MRGSFGATDSVVKRSDNAPRVPIIYDGSMIFRCHFDYDNEKIDLLVRLADVTDIGFTFRPKGR